MAFVCPVTPNPASFPSREKAIDRYAAWLEEVLLPAVRKELPEAKVFGIDGCSMGGLLALEVFLRRPTLFQSFGMVQAAFGAIPWLATVKKLRGALEQHIRKEEQEIWPRIERVWNPARLEEAGRQMEAMKHGQAAKAH